MQLSQYDNPDNVPFTAQDWNRVTELLLKMSAALNKQDFSVPVAVQAQEDKDGQCQKDRDIQVQVDFRVPCQTPSL